MLLINKLLECLTPWEPSFIYSGACFAAAICFICGKPSQLSVFRQICFWTGLISAYIVSHTVFDYYAEHEFFMHRIQHVVLHHGAPFLIALSSPGAVLLQGMPVKWKHCCNKIADSTTVQLIADILNRPMIAITLFTGLILFWLIPQVHFLAMLDWRLYRLMNWGMLITGLIFWNLVLNNFSIKPAQLSPACRIAMLLVVVPPQIVMGMMIFMSPHELYPLYSICGRAFSMNPLADQQIGGLILWIPAAMMSVLGILIVMYREWMSKSQPSFSKIFT